MRNAILNILLETSFKACYQLAKDETTSLMNLIYKIYGYNQITID